MKSLVFALFSCLAARACSAAEDACGGTFRGFQYTITSPNYPNNYPSRTECTYNLQAEQPTDNCEQQFHLQFLDFNLKPSEGCRGDYLQVGDKNVYCGHALGLRKFAAKNNSLQLTFHSDQKGTARGFKILVSALPCSLKLNPLKNSYSRGLPAQDVRSSFSARDVNSLAYRRGIRGDNEVEVNHSVTRPKMLVLTNDVNPSIRRPLIDSANPSVNNGNRVTSYLFLPPKETNANVTLHYVLGSAISDKGWDDGSALPPSRDLLAPAFAGNAISSFSKHDNALDKQFGDAASLDYDAQPADKSRGQTLLPSDGSSERINYDPTLDSQGYGSSSNLVYDPRYGFVTSGYPNAGYPNSGYNVGYPNAGYPNAGYSDGGYPGGYNPNYSTDYPGGFSSGYPIGGAGGIGSGSYPSYPGYEPNYNPGIGGGFIGPTGECCQLPTASRFSIASPGFPGGSSPGNGYSCRYTIVKASPQACRLRLNFRFFNFGSEDPYCSLGYVDVDGQRFCGCRTGQSLQLLFGDYYFKTITVFNAANTHSRLSGFLIDVTQEACAQPGYPGYPGQYNPGYPGYPSYLQRRSVNASTFVPSPIDPSPLVRAKRDLGYAYAKPAVPFSNGNVEPIRNQQTQERFFNGNCQSRLALDWAIASKEAFFKNARCPATPGYGIPGLGGRFARSYSSETDELAESTCEQIHETEGEIKSPLYPENYPANLRKCYRFNLAPNFCKLELYVRDFDLESSQDCASDYLSFSVEGKRHCGESLNDFRTVFDLTRMSSLEVDFASDERGTGRGFDIGFTQLPCEMTAAAPTKL